MKKNNHVVWNILSITVSCFLLITTSSHGMFGEGYEEQKKAKEAAKERAAQQQIERDLTAPENQGGGSGTLARGDLSSGKGLSERMPEIIEQDQMILIIARSCFSSLTQDKENDLISQGYDKLRNMERFLEGSNRILTKEENIFIITSAFAEKAGVSPRKPAEAVAAYNQAVAEIGAKLGLEGRPTEEVVEISGRLREYEREASILDDPELTEQGKINFAARIAAKIDARNAAARIAAEQRWQKELEESRLAEIAASQQPAIKAAAPTHVAPVAVATTPTASPTIPKAPAALPQKAASTLPPPPPQESAFDKQKKASLQNLQSQLAAARNELARHEATRNRLQSEFNQHIQNVKVAEEGVAKFEKENPVRMVTSIFKPSVRLGRLYDAQNIAIRDKKQFENTKMDNLNSAKNSIDTLSTCIRNLEQEHRRVDASIDPIILEQQRQEAEAARVRAFEQKREQDIKEATAAALALRRELEIQYGITPQQNSGSHSPSEEMKRMSRVSSKGTDSDGGSPPSTPPGALKTESNSKDSSAPSSEVEALQAEIARVHQIVTIARKAIKEAENKVVTTLAESLQRFDAWDDYFKVAEERSDLKQRLATLIGNNLEPAFKASDKRALIPSYKKYFYENEGALRDLHTDNYFMKKLKQLYEKHRVLTIGDDIVEAWKLGWENRSTEVKRLEQDLTKELQETRQDNVMKLLREELGLLAAEEQPEVLYQIGECIWPNMPGFSDADRRNAIWSATFNVNVARNEAELNRKYPQLAYTTERAARDRWEREGRGQQIANMQWNIGQTIQMNNAMANGGFYFPTYR